MAMCSTISAALPSVSMRYTLCDIDSYPLKTKEAPPSSYRSPSLPRKNENAPEDHFPGGGYRSDADWSALKTQRRTARRRQAAQTKAKDPKIAA